jgi:plastocyanin
MRVSRLFFALVVVAALVSACSGDGEGATSTIGEPADQTTRAVDTTEGGSVAPASITIANFDFSGAESVAVGTPVIVTNEDDVSHTWTSEDDVFDSGSLSQGESFQYTFEDAGEYSFVCTIHPGMSGSISVEG